MSTTTTRLGRDFDPDAVQDLKAAATSDVTIGGANLAARAMAAGLVDECQLFVWPMIVGGGKPALPAGIRTNLELLDEHRFDNGVVHLRYHIPTARAAWLRPSGSLSAASLARGDMSQHRATTKWHAISVC